MANQVKIQVPSKQWANFIAMLAEEGELATWLNEQAEERNMKSELNDLDEIASVAFGGGKYSADNVVEFDEVESDEDDEDEEEEEEDEDNG